MAPRKKPRFTKVTSRFLTEDVEALKQQATEAGELNWQVRLRRLVHEAVKNGRRSIK